MWVCPVDISEASHQEVEAIALFPLTPGTPQAAEKAEVQWYLLRYHGVRLPFSRAKHVLRIQHIFAFPSSNNKHIQSQMGSEYSNVLSSAWGTSEWALNWTQMFAIKQSKAICPREGFCYPWLWPIHSFLPHTFTKHQLCVWPRSNPGSQEAQGAVPRWLQTQHSIMHPPGCLFICLLTQLASYGEHAECQGVEVGQVCACFTDKRTEAQRSPGRSLVTIQG